MKKLVRATAILLAVVSILLLGSYVYYRTGAGAQPEFMISFIDVGQGDCALILCNGESMLVDGGNPGDGDDIIEYLRANYISHLDAVFVSHCHSDHIGGLEEVIDELGADRIYMYDRFHNTDVYFDLLDCIGQNGLEVITPRVGDRFDLGGADIIVIADGVGMDDANNASVVIKVRYGGHTALFTGDIEEKCETMLINRGADLGADILKVAHHGSGSSSTLKFLMEVAPDISVISVGRNNQYNHPNERTVDYLTAISEVHRTDIEGTVSFKLGEDGFEPYKKLGYVEWILGLAADVLGKSA